MGLLHASILGIDFEAFDNIGTFFDEVPNSEERRVLSFMFDVIFDKITVAHNLEGLFGICADLLRDAEQKSKQREVALNASLSYPFFPEWCRTVNDSRHFMQCGTPACVARSYNNNFPLSPIQESCIYSPVREENTVSAPSKNSRTKGISNDKEKSNEVNSKRRRLNSPDRRVKLGTTDTNKTASSKTKKANIHGAPEKGKSNAHKIIPKSSGKNKGKGGSYVAENDSGASVLLEYTNPSQNNRTVQSSVESIATEESILFDRSDKPISKKTSSSGSVKNSRPATVETKKQNVSKKPVQDKSSYPLLEASLNKYCSTLDGCTDFPEDSEEEECNRKGTKNKKSQHNSRSNLKKSVSTKNSKQVTDQVRNSKKTLSDVTVKKPPTKKSENNKKVLSCNKEKDTNIKLATSEKNSKKKTSKNPSAAKKASRTAKVPAKAGKMPVTKKKKIDTGGMCDARRHESFLTDSEDDMTINNNLPDMYTENCLHSVLEKAGPSSGRNTPTTTVFNSIQGISKDNHLGNSDLEIGSSSSLPSENNKNLMKRMSKNVMVTNRQKSRTNLRDMDPRVLKLLEAVTLEKNKITPKAVKKIFRPEVEECDSDEPEEQKFTSSDESDEF